MHFIIAGFVIIVVVFQCQAEVVLEKGSNETVTFDGDEVEIKVQNPDAIELTAVIFCFASTVDDVPMMCPKGYLQYNFIAEGSQSLKVNRQCQLFYDPTLVRTAERIKFDTNGNLNIMITEISKGTIVIMPNAEIYVPEKPVEETKRVKPNSSSTVYVVIACAVVFILALLIIGVVVYFCVIRKKNEAKIASMVVNEEENLGEISDKSLETPTCFAEPEIKIHTQQLTSPTTPITSHRSSDHYKLKPPLRQTMPKLNVQQIPKTSLKASAIPEKNQFDATTQITKSSAKAETPESPRKAPTPLEKTQLTNKQRSPPTDTFSIDEVANAASENSRRNVRRYLKNSEASIPNTSQSRSRS